MSKQDEDLISNILPSYHMFQSTISKTLDSREEDFSRQPPMYEMTPISSATSLSGIQSPFSTQSSVSLNEFPFPLTNQSEEEQIEIWQNTILANIHKLKNLNRTDNPIPKNLEVNVSVTKEVCQKGVKPDIIDVSDREFKQGDYIHGFVTIENHSDEPIAFDMVYIVFEGTLIILKNSDGLIDTQTPQIAHKFLNMTDLFASWSFANIDRLTTDNGDPHDWCEGETDPYDNTLLSLDLTKSFAPHVKYKRFFSFKIPDKLLDDICEDHSLNSHTLLPPSLGFPKYSLRPSSLLAKKKDAVKDLSFLDTSTNYSVECRIIGKAHDYKLDLKKDQYVIANESRQIIRVIPTAIPVYSVDNDEAFRYYKAFVKSVTDLIDLGRALLSTREDVSGLSLSPAPSQDSKVKQLYRSVRNDNKKSYIDPSSYQFFDNIYQNIITYKKKTLLSQKAMKMISLSTPKARQTMDYIPPLKFRKQEHGNTTFSIPLKLTYHEESPKEFPEIKSVKAELVVVSVKGSHHPIPVEFTHEMFINQDEFRMIGNKAENDLFVEEITVPFTKRTKELTRLIEKVGSDTFKVDKQLYYDVKAMATLQAKFSTFPIDGETFSFENATGKGKSSNFQNIPWLPEGEQVSKIFNMEIDINKCYSKAHNIPKGSKFLDHINLVPDHQTCFSVRMHYIKITIKFAHDSLTVKVPLTIIN